jgi:crossover junction endodeoxyribonuclease RuvC
LGWGVVEVKNELHYLAHGTFKSQPKQALSQRLAAIHCAVKEKLLQFRPDYVIVEQTFVNSNPLSALHLGHARGVILATAALQEIKVIEYAPTQLKKAIVGAGHATKDQMRSMVMRLLLGCPELDSLDAADALALALCHAHHIGNRYDCAVAGKIRSL